MPWLGPRGRRDRVEGPAHHRLLPRLTLPQRRDDVSHLPRSPREDRPVGPTVCRVTRCAKSPAGMAGITRVGRWLASAQRCSSGVEPSNTVQGHRSGRCAIPRPTRAAQRGGQVSGPVVSHVLVGAALADLLDRSVARRTPRVSMVWATSMLLAQWEMHPGRRPGRTHGAHPAGPASDAMTQGRTWTAWGSTGSSSGRGRCTPTGPIPRSPTACSRPPTGPSPTIARVHRPGCWGGAPWPCSTPTLTPDAPPAVGPVRGIPAVAPSDD